LKTCRPEDLKTLRVWRTARLHDCTTLSRITTYL
jgi:hypothetical protein